MEVTTVQKYIVILGGDKRELIMGNILEEQGFNLLYFGFENTGKDNKYSLIEALTLGDIIIAPLSGIDNNGKVKAHYSHEEIILTIDNLFKIRPGSLFISGRIPDAIKNILTSKNVIQIESANRSDLACLNAIPTAEGAIQLAMEKSEITIYESKCLVLGFGRCAKALAIKLAALGAEVFVAARNSSAVAEAKIYEHNSFNLNKLNAVSTKLADFDFIFNTIPALILTENIIQKMSNSSLLIDLASYPGGIDTDAAKKFSIPFIHALGLPGKVAPISAGRILASVYLPLILNNFG